MNIKKIAGALLITIVGSFLGLVVLVAASMESSHAATTKTYKPTSSYKAMKARKKTTKKIAKAFERDDDVECSTLRNSRYAADREVYRRYC